MRIKELRYWVQKVLPLVYDDSLSYYELLNRVVVKLNEVIQLANGIDERITEEVNTVLNEWLENGTFEELINQTVLSDLNDKIDGAIEDIGSLNEEVGNLDERVDELEERPSSVITPQSLGYPDTKTADEAFAILATYTDNPIIIPSGTYHITNEYRLENVIIDEGTYDSMNPVYKKKLYFDFQSLGAGKTIILPSDSYIEAVCYDDGYYYGAAYHYTSDTTDYLIKYDANFNQLLIGYMDRPPADAYSSHAPGGIYSDGTYLYVDLARVTKKYNKNTLTVVETFNHEFGRTYYYNNSFWGLMYSGNSLIVCKCNNDFTIAESHTIDRGVTEGAQSWTIHKGIIYALTDIGYHTLIDMYDWSFENIYYNSQMEIENIFFVDEKPCFSGHCYGINNMWNFGVFNGGQSNTTFNKYVFDGSTMTWNLNIPNKFGVFDFTNYQVGVFGNSGKMIMFDDLIYAIVGDWILVYNGSGWRLAGTKQVISITIASGMVFRIETNGTINLWCLNYGLATTDGEVEVACDASTIFALLGMSDTSSRTGYVFGSAQSGLPMSNGVAGARVIVEKTKVRLQPFYVLGTPAAVSLYGSFQLLE